MLSEKILKYKSDYLPKAIELNAESSFYTCLHTNLKAHDYYSIFRKKLKKLYSNAYIEDSFLNTYLGKNLSSVEISEQIFSKLKTIFDAKNQNIYVEVEGVEKSELNLVVKKYLEYFKTSGFDSLKSLPNSIVIIDIDENEKPYLYNLNPKFIEYIDFEKNGDIEEIIFSFDKEDYFYYTKDFYSKYEKTENGFVEIYTTPHNLESFPGCLFLKDSYSNENKFLAKTVISNQLDNLHKFVVKDVELYKSEFATSFSTKIQPDSSCGYHQGEEICKGGKIYNSYNLDEAGNPSPILFEEGTQKICPVCGNSRIVGAGATIFINLKKLADMNSNVNNIITEFTPNLEGTNYQKDRLTELKNEIIYSCIGKKQSSVKLARNEKDVISDYEDTSKILSDFSKIYQITINDIIGKVLKLIYQKEVVLNIFIGDEYFLQTKEELINEKNSAINPLERTNAILNLIEYENKHNVEKKSLYEKILKLMPYSGITDTEFLEYVKFGKVSDFDFELRTNINYYINEFEKKYKNSISLLDIEFIQKEIEKLINEKIKKYERKEVETTTIS